MTLASDADAETPLPVTLSPRRHLRLQQTGLGRLVMTPVVLSFLIRTVPGIAVSLTTTCESTGDRLSPLLKETRIFIVAVVSKCGFPSEGGSLQ